jgi:aspartate aminotransferase
MLSLKKAICEKLSGITASPMNRANRCFHGAKHSLYNTFVTLCNPGDEVILPAPYWSVIMN